MVLGDLDADGNIDAVTRWNAEWSFFAGDGAGKPRTQMRGTAWACRC